MKSVPEFIAIGEMSIAIQTGSVKDRREKKFSAINVTKMLDHNTFPCILKFTLKS